MKSTFSIIFYLKRQVVKKDGTVPVMGRITVDGTQAQFSCKTTANPDLWDKKLILIWVTRRIFLGLRQSEALLLGNSK